MIINFSRWVVGRILYCKYLLLKISYWRLDFARLLANILIISITVTFFLAYGELSDGALKIVYSSIVIKHYNWLTRFPFELRVIHFESHMHEFFKIFLLRVSHILTVICVSWTLSYFRSPSWSSIIGSPWASWCRLHWNVIILVIFWSFQIHRKLFLIFALFWLFVRILDKVILLLMNSLKLSCLVLIWLSYSLLLPH